MPSFGMYTAEGTLVEWLAPPDARVEVQAGDTIAAIDTEKATNEIRGTGVGVLHRRRAGRHAAQGRGACSATSSTAGELDAPATAPRRRSGVILRRSAGAAPSPATARVPANTGWTIKASPHRPQDRRRARHRPRDAATGSGPGGRIVEADVSRRWHQRRVAPRTDAAGSAGGRDGLP